MTKIQNFHFDKDFSRKIKHLETTKSFLGKEYLNWLWFFIETNHNNIFIPKIGHVKLFMDERMVQVAATGSVREQCLKGTAPSFGEEAHAGLISGKVLSECKFLLTIGSKTWSWVLHGDDLSLRSVKLPPFTSDDSDDPLAHRIEALDILTETNASLYSMFLNIRLSEENLKREVGLMNTWVLERLNSSFAVT